MNSRAKGRRSELKTKAYLEANGWIVDLVKGSSKFNKSVDFFNLFDGIAIKKGVVLFIQVKSNRKPSLKLFKEFHNKYQVPIDIFIWKDRIKEPIIINVR